MFTGTVTAYPFSIGRVRLSGDAEGKNRADPLARVRLSRRDKILLQKPETWRDKMLLQKPETSFKVSYAISLVLSITDMICD